MAKKAPVFPKPLRHRGRVVFLRSDLERYKRELIAVATGGRLEPSKAPDVELFVLANEAAKELGLSRRTLDAVMARTLSWAEGWLSRVYGETGSTHEHRRVEVQPDRTNDAGVAPV